MHARGWTETRKDEAKAWRDVRAMRRESTRPSEKEDERKKQHEKRRTHYAEAGWDGEAWQATAHLRVHREKKRPGVEGTEPCAPS